MVAEQGQMPSIPTTSKVDPERKEFLSLVQ